ncbi:hypothetical protein [Psychromicrobium xiongbiense]|uniref:hypothetical protein n=1 Tax=Psychromicrobium xiongbiense TaxID=3051184 RepID=UPI00255218C9|nr:hypothetical protein [Psychromicrobium sp. YIM S02556]
MMSNRPDNPEPPEAADGTPEDGAPDGERASEHPHDSDDTEAVWLDLVARLQADGLDESSGLNPAVDSTSTRAPFASYDPLGVQISAADLAASAEADYFPDSRGPRDYSAAEDEEGFVPEEPASLRGSEPALVLGWVGALGAPAALLLAVFFWRDIPAMAIVFLVLAFLAGVGYLVYRMPQGHDDDGARL